MAQFKAKIEDFDAPDVRAFYDSETLRVWHLAGRERTFTIEAVQRITTEFMGEEKKRALLRLRDSKGRRVPLPLVLNPTNRNTVIGLYGTTPKAWVGKTITLYPTTCDSPRGVVDCIRIRPTLPAERGGVRTTHQGVHVLPSGGETIDTTGHEARAGAAVSVVDDDGDEFETHRHDAPRANDNPHTLPEGMLHAETIIR